MLCFNVSNQSLVILNSLQDDLLKQSINPCAYQITRRKNIILYADDLMLQHNSIDYLGLFVKRKISYNSPHVCFVGVAIKTHGKSVFKVVWHSQCFSKLLRSMFPPKLLSCTSFLKFSPKSVFPPLVRNANVLSAQF